MFDINGYIQVEEITGGGWDEWGDPVPATVSWSKPIPCDIQTITSREDGITYEDGHFKHSSHRIFIELYDRTTISFNPQRIKIEKFGEDLGDWQVQRRDFIEEDDLIKITV